MDERSKIWGAVGARPSRSDAVASGFRWGPWATLGWLALVGILTIAVMALVVSVIVGIGYILATGGETAETNFETYLRAKITELFLPLTIVQALFGTAAAFYLSRGKNGETRTRLLALQPISVWHFLKWTGLAVLAVTAVSELPQVFVDLGHDQARGFLDFLKPVWLAMILLVVLAPVSEEVLFRGFAFAGLAASRLGPVGAIVITSGLWAIIHVQYEWPLIVQIFFIGMVFGTVRWKSGSLWPPIAAHAAINLVAGVAAYGQDWGLF